MMKKDLRRIGERISASLDGAEIMACAYVANKVKQREGESMANVKMSPSNLKRLIDEVDSLDLSLSKKESIRALAEAELERRKGEYTVQEFHNWIRRGDQILSEVESELAQLRALSSPDGEFVSRAAVLEVLNSLFSDDETDRYEKGRNWVLGQAIKKIERLPAKSEGGCDE